MTQEKHPAHEALLLADMLGFVQSITPMPQDAARLLRQQHALIVQMAAAFEDEHFEHDDQRKAIAAAKEYLK